MYIVSDRAVKALYEHRYTAAIEKRENTRPRRPRRRRRLFFRIFRPAASPMPVVRVATSSEGAK